MKKPLTEIQLLKIKSFQEKIHVLDNRLGKMKEKHTEQEDAIIIKASRLFQDIELIKNGVK